MGNRAPCNARETLPARADRATSQRRFRRLGERCYMAPAMMTLPLGRISGRALAAIVTAVRKTPARVPLARLLRAQLGIDALRALPADDRAPLPFSHAPLCARPHHQRTSEELALSQPVAWPRPVASFAEHYRNGRA